MKSRFIDKSILFQKLVPTLLVVCSITLILLIPLAIWVAYGPMADQTDTVTIGNSNNILLPLLSAGLMAVFAIFVLNRYISSNKLHFFFWGTGLLMFSVVSLSGIYLSMQWNRWAFSFGTFSEQYLMRPGLDKEQFAYCYRASGCDLLLHYL